MSRLNGRKFIMNCELIKTMEATPDTVITLTAGDKIMVKESIQEVLRMAMDYRKRLHQEPPSAPSITVTPPVPDPKVATRPGGPH